MNETESKGAATKSAGVTPTERMLADFCERSFLKLWSYLNPYKDGGHELCDLLPAVVRHPPTARGPVRSVQKTKMP